MCCFFIKFKFFHVEITCFLSGNANRNLIRILLLEIVRFSSRKKPFMRGFAWLYYLFLTRVHATSCYSITKCSCNYTYTYNKVDNKARVLWKMNEINKCRDQHELSDWYLGRRLTAEAAVLAFVGYSDVWGRCLRINKV